MRAVTLAMTTAFFFGGLFLIGLIASACTNRAGWRGLAGDGLLYCALIGLLGWAVLTTPTKASSAVSVSTGASKHHGSCGKAETTASPCR